MSLCLLCIESIGIRGIVGLIAGRLVEKTGKPAFALTKSGEYLVGSGRSTGGFHLVEAMQACGDIFKKAGGHPQACGLTLPPNQLSVFTEKMRELAKNYFDGEELRPLLPIDLEIPLESVTETLLDELLQMQPFGRANEEPVFLSRMVKLHEVRTVGAKERHVRLVADAGGRRIPAIAFGFGSMMKSLSSLTFVDLVYSVRENRWNGRRSLQLFIHDIVAL
jgi:single-stranded-DNA-specific exonuclease